MEQKVIEFNPKNQIIQGRAALDELRNIVQNREDKLVINGKQYLFFYDWQLLGAFFNITTRVTETEVIEKQVQVKDSDIILLEFLGYKAKADATDINGNIISSAEAICLNTEKNWQNKDRFAILSMAQTRACAKALRNCLSWVVKMPSTNKQQEFSDEVAEEI